MRQIRRNLESIRELLESSARGRTPTTYIDWDKDEDVPEGKYWGFVIKAVYPTT